MNEETKYAMYGVAKEAFDEIVTVLGLEGWDIPLIILDNPESNDAGSYISFFHMIQLNFATLRTKRDIIFTLAHELRHAFQHMKMGDEKFTLVSSRGSTKLDNKDFAGYFFSAVEYDANTWAIDYENKLDYKNEVLNKDCEHSFFVYTKQNMANTNFALHHILAQMNIEKELQW